MENNELLENTTNESGEDISLIAEPTKKKSKKKPVIIIAVIVIACAFFVLLLGKSPSEKVVSQIEKIGVVSLDSVEVIAEAESAYNELDDSLKAEVSNADVLVEAIEKYNRLKTAYDAIEAIGEVKNTRECAALIEVARSYYDECSGEEKALVTNYVKLEEAETVFSDLKVKEVISLIKKIGKVTLESEEKIEEARLEYSFLSSEAKEEVTNFKTLTEAEDRLRELKKEKADIALAKLRKKTDKVEGITWYEAYAMPVYVDTRCFVLPYIGQNNFGTWLRLKMNYTGDDWIFFESVTFLIDGKRTVKSLNKYSDIVRDNDYGIVWEVGDIAAGTDEIEMIKSIINSKETVVRFQGDEYHYDLTISANDKKAMQQVIEAYELTK